MESRHLRGGSDRFVFTIRRSSDAFVEKSQRQSRRSVTCTIPRLQIPRMEITRRESRSIRTSEMTSHSASTRDCPREKGILETRDCIPDPASALNRSHPHAKASIAVHSYFFPPPVKSVSFQVSSLRWDAIFTARIAARAVFLSRLTRFSPPVDVVVNHPVTCFAGERFGLATRNRRNGRFGYPSTEEHEEQRAAGSERETRTTSESVRDFGPPSAE